MTDLGEQQALLDKVSATYRRSSRQDDLLRLYFVKAVEPWYLLPDAPGDWLF